MSETFVGTPLMFKIPVTCTPMPILGPEVIVAGVTRSMDNSNTPSVHPTSHAADLSHGLRVVVVVVGRLVVVGATVVVVDVQAGFGCKAQLPGVIVKPFVPCGHGSVIQHVPSVEHWGSFPSVANPGL